MINEKSKSSNKIRKLENDVQFIARIRQIIIKNMKKEGFGVCMLCKLAFISRTQLHIKLKSLANLSTSHYIRRIRIEKASQMLRETKLNIKNISLEIGIESPSYFSRIFNLEVGLCPQKYREKYKLEQ